MKEKNKGDSGDKLENRKKKSTKVNLGCLKNNKINKSPAEETTQIIKQKEDVTAHFINI